VVRSGRHQQQRDRFSHSTLGTIRTLGKPDRVEATRQFAYVFQLLGNELHLFVDVSELTRRLMCKQNKSRRREKRGGELS
jgi:hypothetical protein